jgi:hypothetical protein
MRGKETILSTIEHEVIHLCRVVEIQGKGRFMTALRYLPMILDEEGSEGQPRKDGQSLLAEKDRKEGQRTFGYTLPSEV